MNKMQIDLNKIEKWCDEWGFTMSTEKTVGVIFSHHHKQLETPALRLKNRGPGEIPGSHFRQEAQLESAHQLHSRQMQEGVERDAELDGTEMGSGQTEPANDI